MYLFLLLLAIAVAWYSVYSVYSTAHEPFVGGLFKAVTLPGRFLKGTATSGAKYGGVIAGKAAPGVGSKAAGAATSSVSRWQKADTALSAASLLTLPLFFIPFGGGGDDEGDAVYGGEEEAAAAASSVSTVSCSCSFFVMMMMMMMTMANDD
jgi:hypothetical protein